MLRFINIFFLNFHHFLGQKLKTDPQQARKTKPMTNKAISIFPCPLSEFKTKQDLTF